MNKKHTLKKTAALLLALALTVGATGCDFLLTDNQKDLKLKVATVNISDSLKDNGMSCADEVQQIIENGGLSTEIPKRDLIAYFLSTGYTYVQSYGYSYEDTFNMLMDTLVNRKVLTQYAVAYYLENNADLSADGCAKYIEKELKEVSSEKEKELLIAHPEVLTMKYFLTKDGKESADKYNEAVYSLKKSLNDSLDSAESSYITATTKDEHTHDETRTTPTNANVEKDDYIPLKENGELDYDVYTGRNALDSCGTYEKVDGSTVTSRKKAYNAFLSSLQGYGLIQEGEDTSVITELDYYYLELSSTLAQALINQYGEDLKDEATSKLTSEYVANKYNEIKDAQKTAYETDTSAFSTALDSVSDDSFVLYGQKDFGFVYNILIPFSSSQSRDYSAAKNAGLKQDELFNVRKDLLENVQAKDLRSAWFCSEEDENYSFTATGEYYKNSKVEGNATNYLFFENNLTKNDQYEKLTQYAGAYPYNGSVTTDEDGEYTCTPYTLSIDGFIAEMESYIDYTLNTAKGTTGVTYAQSTSTTSPTRTESYKANTVYTTNGKVDYSKFLYYEGKVTLTNTNRADFFNAEKNGTKNDAYAALSAVNELMFAYSTDTGCLNTYMGYVVSPYKTDFVSEFEYAAQYAVKKGVGNYVVCPSDYGWHIIYVAFVYDADDGDVYGGYIDAEKEVEGTFSYLFYESLKSTAASSYTTAAQNDILNRYNNDSSVTLQTKNYQDLLDLDSD